MILHIGFDMNSRDHQQERLQDQIFIHEILLSEEQNQVPACSVLA
jgi:Golgi nucleoside diphosphatase